MVWRSSARALFTLVTMLITAVAVFLLIAVVRQSLLQTNPAALNDATTAAWTVAPLLIVVAGFAAWFLGGYVFQPVWHMRRDLTLAARTRAMAESYLGEFDEVKTLRETLVRILREIEQNAGNAESEKRRVFSLMEDLNEGIAQVGPGGRFLHVNRAARKLLALPNQAEGQTAATIIRNPELRELIERSARGEAVAPVEITLENRQLLIAPQSFSRHDSNKGAVITVVDLTELRRLETVRRDFVANVSHELKTPLTSIRGYTETLISDEMSRENQLKFLDVILKNATRLQRIVEELLDLSRLQSGGWTPDLQAVDVKTVAREVWSGCELAASQKQIAFSIEGPELLASADPEALQQIFSNIYENAVRYTPAHGSIKVTISGDAARVVFAVADTGIGIPASALPRIFERFYRVDAARSRADGGTGLGLSIVKHLAERMNGSVTAASTLGAGTTLTVELQRYIAS